jgi:uroporphyrin-III C-methyltransferase
MGVVYLIGAGPGDPGLLTRRAARVLRRADVVVHDALIDRRVLKLARSARLIDVGKRGFGRRTEQEEINALLIEQAAQASTVVRLKGGDPFVFGRGAEEARALTAAGVRVRIVPGITSGLGGLAAAGIPATTRGVSGAVTLVTGHGTGCDPLADVDWQALARVGGTIVIYMAVRTIDQIAERLLAAGLPRGTPAAVLENATWPDERVLEGTLGNIAELAQREEVAAPALFVIGGVVSWRTAPAPVRGARPRISSLGRLEVQPEPM